MYCSYQCCAISACLPACCEFKSWRVGERSVRKKQVASPGWNLLRLQEFKDGNLFHDIIMRIEAG